MHFFDGFDDWIARGDMLEEIEYAFKIVSSEVRQNSRFARDYKLLFAGYRRINSLKQA